MYVYIFVVLGSDAKTMAKCLSSNALRVEEGKMFPIDSDTLYMYV